MPSCVVFDKNGLKTPSTKTILNESISLIEYFLNCDNTLNDFCENFLLFS